MAYDIHGNRVPYDSKTANVKITVRGNTLHTEHQGLPFIEYFYYGGPAAINYMPEPLARQIESDTSNFDRGIKFGIITSLPLPEENARSYARSMEKHYRDMPPATDGALLSTRLSW